MLMKGSAMLIMRATLGGTYEEWKKEFIVRQKELYPGRYRAPLAPFAMRRQMTCAKHPFLTRHNNHFLLEQYHMMLYGAKEKKCVFHFIFTDVSAVISCKAFGCHVAGSEGSDSSVVWVVLFDNLAMERVKLSHDASKPSVMRDMIDDGILKDVVSLEWCVALSLLCHLLFNRSSNFISLCLSHAALTNPYLDLHLSPSRMALSRSPTLI